jgi:hypothetical protein
VEITRQPHHPNRLPADATRLRRRQHFILPRIYAASTFDDPKSPGMQTVHVYFPESTSLSASLRASTTISEAGEDELLEYYGCYR